MIKEILLFPGLVLHEIAHFLMCLVLGVKVKGFKISLREGFVTHVIPKSIIKSLLIAIAPFFFGMLVSYLLITNVRIELISFYLSFVILYMSFPSMEDTRFNTHHHWVKKTITFPLFVIFRILYYFGNNSIVRIVFSIIAILFIGNM